ncbi:restriction endonuclease PLD domain-containing protein [Vibrio cholerae]|uniref:restriction endonuclease PLD domain-containing protein n=1 Tax=Vibrio TaxID=662 RepID=UPI000E0AD2E7|nr:MULTISPECIES: restriction endonuclease PLD domain-containing protein [Vibrio]EJL6601074.1 NgoFVII family restriction endonuclease [Vibrio cholerae]EKF9121826.1 NgoFVII family restriction endonuclease [Vibrio cholerae]ELK8295945.1 NgoFVII family restriction endonuclease [Vibrio cholerae]MDP4494047.1 NgoFVII family restriction endonuclease [Vibrio sp. AH4]
MYNLSLLDRQGEVQDCHGLNWGQNPNNHTTPDDACLVIRAPEIRANPHLFPPVGHIKEIDVIWDDGTKMTMLLEGTQPINGLIYPKQMSVVGDKSILGKYIRTRIGVPHGQPVTAQDLRNYGRTFISVTQIHGVYHFNFS